MKTLKFIICLIMMISLSACKKNEEQSNIENSIIPEIEDDYFEVLAENTYCTYNSYSQYDQLIFYYISGSPLTKEDVNIQFDSKISFDYSVDTDSENEIMPFSVFCSYNGLNWQEYSELINSDEQEDINQAVSISNELNEKYETYNEEDLSKLYKGVIVIQFNSTPELTNKKIEKMYVTVNNNTKEYDLNQLSYDDATMPDESYILVPTGISVWDLDLGVIEDGKFTTLCHFNYEVSETLQINRAYMYNDTACNVESVNVTLTEGENSIQYEWDGKTPFTLSKGSSVDFTLNIEDQDLIGKQLANKHYVVAVEYSVDGQTYYIYCDLMTTVKMNAYEYYALLDSTDYYDYYRYYYNNGDDWEG